MIKFYNRISKDYEIEQVAGESYLKWCYESPIGKGLTELLVKRKLFSKLYGSYCDSKLSKKKVNKFIDEFNIDMSKVQKSKDEFTCFNDFFYRKLTPQGRPIDMAESTLISPGDGRLLAFEDIKMDDLVQVKDITYSLSELIGDDAIAKEYNGGVCLILRLCPTDYHRFHFIDSGIPTETKKIKGNYYSVNPIALEKIPKLFCQNKREWCTFKSDNFGDVICIEVGATCVGGIIQSYSPNTKVSKGDEKGYFKFGGSTTVLFFKKDTIKIDDDIMEQSKKGLECKVQLGEKIGKKIQ